MLISTCLKSQDIDYREMKLQRSWHKQRSRIELSKLALGVVCAVSLTLLAAIHFVGLILLAAASIACFMIGITEARFNSDYKDQHPKNLKPCESPHHWSILGVSILIVLVIVLKETLGW